MTYLLQPEHLAHLYLGVFAPAMLLALVAAHFATRTSPAPVALEPALPPLVPLRKPAEVAEVADKAAWLAGMAEAMTVGDDLTGGELVPAVEAVGEIPDDAVPVDMAAVMAEQDIEEGREFVDRVERMLALETAVTFGFIYLAGATR